MKKTISICIFFLIFILCVTGLIYLYLPKQNEIPKEIHLAAEEATEEPKEAAESMSVQKPDAYIIKILDGMLVVYESDGETMLFGTNIRAVDLDDNTRKKAEEGIGFADEMELYDFLESYSS